MDGGNGDVGFRGREVGVFMETFEHTGCAILARGFIFILFIFFMLYTTIMYINKYVHKYPTYLM